MRAKLRQIKDQLKATRHDGVEIEDALFATLALRYTPLYFNAEYVRERILELRPRRLRDAGFRPVLSWERGPPARIMIMSGPGSPRSVT